MMAGELIKYRDEIPIVRSHLQELAFLILALKTLKFDDREFNEAYCKAISDNIKASGFY